MGKTTFTARVGLPQVVWAALAALLAHGSAYAQAAAATAAAAADSDATSLEEVVVTGSRLGNSGFNTPTPVTVLDSAALEEGAPVNLLSVLNEIPSARPTRSAVGNSRNSSSQDGIQGLVDLRGIGTARTLTLVDGQRVVAGGQSGSVDTNMIPLNLIDRVEIVTGGASAAYGSDAVAGVANIVLKERMSGLKFGVQAGASGHSDGKQIIVNLGAGTSFADDKGHLLFGADYSKNEGTGNVYVRSFGAAEQGLLGTGAVGSANRPAGTPAQIWATNVERNDGSPGGLISTGPLAGTGFNANGVPYAFQIGTRYGTSMIGSTANYGNAPQGFFKYINPFKQATAYGKASYEVSDALTLSVSANYGHVRMEQHGSSPLTTSPFPLIIAIDNPYLPAATRTAMTAAGVSTINVGKFINTLGTAASGQGAQVNELLRFSFGAKGKIGSNWNWDAYVAHGRTNQDVKLPYSPYTANIAEAAYAVRAADGSIVCGPIATNPNLNATTRTQVQSGCVPFNIFGILPLAGNESVYGYMFQQTNFQILARQTSAGVNLRGSAFNTWAGPINFATGAEYRRDTLEQTAGTLTSILPAVYSAGTSYPYAGRNSVTEGYGEVGLPLARNNGALLKAIDADLAGRYTKYTVGGPATTWKAGLTWDINDALRIRGTRSRDIRAANIYELFGNQGPLPTTQINNPFNGQVGNVTSSSVGNPFLKPEIADTYTAGFVLKPTGALDGFRASVDYFDIRLDRVIATLAAQDVINGCFRGATAYCSQITFNSTALGISAVNSTTANLNSLYSNGVDVEIGYRIPVLPASIPGAIDIRFLGTWTRHSSITTVTGTVNYAGSAAGGPINTGIGVPKMRGSLNIGYTNKGLSTQLQLSGFSSLLYNPTLVGPDDPAYNPSASNSISQNKFPSAIYANWSGSYTLPFAGGKSSLFWNVNNVFDKQPPLYSLVAFSFGSANYYDTVGRYYQIGIKADLF